MTNKSQNKLVDFNPEGYLNELLANPSNKQLFAQVVSASISPTGQKPIRIRNNGNWHKSTVSSSQQNAQSIMRNMTSGDLENHPIMKSAAQASGKSSVSSQNHAQAKTLRHSMDQT